MTLHPVDARELTELLRFLDDWLTTDHDLLDTSLQRFVGHPAYNLNQLRTDLHRFAFLLGDDPAFHSCGPVLVGAMDEAAGQRGDR